MGPKEKAYDLFKKIHEELGLNSDAIPQVKRICLLIVEEIIQANPTIKGTSDDLLTQIVQTKAYWYRVRECLNAL